MHSHHYETLINIPLAAVWMTMPWWIQLFEDGSWAAGKLIPYVGLAVAILQLWYLIRKMTRRS